MQNGLYDTAEQDLKLAIQTDPTYDLAHYNLGKVYQKQRKWDKAMEAFEGAAERAPTNANYQYDLGEVSFEAKRVDKAEAAFKRATELDDKLFKAHWRLGLVYIVEEKPKEADAALRKAIDANPRMDKPFVALGHLYLDYDAAKEAAQVFAECVRANENSAECHNGQGLALKDIKQFEQATSQFKKALELEPSLTTALYNAGMTYADWWEQTQSPDHKERAREYLQKVRHRSGHQGQRLWLREGRQRQAVRAQRLLELDSAFGPDRTKRRLDNESPFLRPEPELCSRSPLPRCGGEG